MKQPNDTCQEKQEFSFCVPIEELPWCITLEAIAIKKNVLEE